LSVGRFVIFPYFFPAKIGKQAYLLQHVTVFLA